MLEVLEASIWKTRMPYYVYAIHTDETGNRLYDTFDRVEAAEKLEREMAKGCYPRDNYFVTLIAADNADEAAAKANELRPIPRR